MNISEQADVYLKYLGSRRRKPIKPRTIETYRSFIRTWIGPLIGSQDLETFENGAMKGFVGKLAEADLSPATVIGITNLVKAIVGSAIDENGNELYPRKWNNDFLDVPVLDPRDQDAPEISPQEVYRAISQAPRQFGALIALLAASGLRISEALALKSGPDDGKGSFWLPSFSKLVIRGQLQNGQFLAPKSRAGFREVDICPELCSHMASLNNTSEVLFSFPLRTAHAKAEELHVPGFHSLRRFRVTRLREYSVPEDLIRFWVGHGRKSITDGYSRLENNVEVRKQWCEKVGLGFNLTLA